MITESNIPEGTPWPNLDGTEKSDAELRRESIGRQIDTFDRQAASTQQLREALKYPSDPFWFFMQPTNPFGNYTTVWSSYLKH